MCGRFVEYRNGSIVTNMYKIITACSKVSIACMSVYVSCTLTRRQLAWVLKLSFHSVSLWFYTQVIFS